MNTQSPDFQRLAELLPSGANLAFVEEIFAAFQDDPASAPPAWRAYFEQLTQSETANGSNGAANGHATNGANGSSTRPANGRAANGTNGTNGQAANGQAANGRTTNGHIQLGPTFAPSSIFNPQSLQNGTTAPKENPATSQGTATYLQTPHASGSSSAQEIKTSQERVGQLIRAFRVRGHMIAQLDPLGLPRPSLAELELSYYGFEDADLDRPFAAEESLGGVQPLRDILDHLRDTYCRGIGVQFTHIDDLDVRLWLQDRMESTRNRIELSREEQVRILTRLTDAVMFEEFIRRKFVGAKSFSLEGAESLVPLLDMAIEEAGESGVSEIVMGMAHRGRLNVLANIIGKSPRQIFAEFEDRDADLYTGGGDVKYHLGYANEYRTVSGKRVELSLCFNPSHLEFVNPVAMGRTRAKQDHAGDTSRAHGLTLLIHGDAAFAGEGIIQETLNMSQLPAYTIGGTLHVVVNNQIGFTTAPSESRSSVYATDVAKMLQVPIFHVNGEDPEAVAAVVKIALDFRRMWGRDVVIDMYCYRRLGHNEADEPSFTQPLLYKAIQARKSVREGYLDKLLQMGGVTREEADAIADKRRQLLEDELARARRDDYHLPSPVSSRDDYKGGLEKDAPEVATSVDRTRLSTLLEATTRLPEDFHPHPVIKKLLATRLAMAQGNQPLNWAAGEALAFATLATEPKRPVHIRLTGQDVERGTFSHRHAVLHDVETDRVYAPLRHLSSTQAPVDIYNSPLSETGVLGFEYGYSLDSLAGLTLWEAQFGDFWNVAQPIVDQFIASAEDKWRHLSGLVMLLPHGFEGMGPEHSSARLERFLMMAAEDNMQIVYPTTPAQYFHLLRRQVLRPWRKPLIVMSPKSLLRHLEAVSPLDDFANGTWQPIIPDQGERDPQAVNRVLFCSGKIYYELDKEREGRGRNDVAILRIEQLYPFDEQKLQAQLAPYRADVEVVWVQEEPENMGAWRFMKLMFCREMFGHTFTGVYRPASASPATGSASSHKKEQERVLNAAFGE
jgi:2-oxoglutarate dehydrogenase E1 component